MASGKTVAVLSPGEMGSQIGRVLHEAGTRVVTHVAGRSERTTRRAQQAGFAVLPGLDDIVRESDLIVCILPSLSAKPQAEDVAAAIRRTGARPLYLEANSIGPQTAQAIGRIIEQAGGTFVDGSIIGNATQLQSGAVFYLSGERAEDVEGYLQPALTTSILGTEPGQASGFKVIYAGLTKGLSALGVELLAGAERLGLTTQILDKYQAHHPSVRQFFEHTLPGLPPRAGRRSEEMVELAETLEELGLSAHMAHAAQVTLEELSERYRRDGGPDGEDLPTLIQWLASA